MRLPRRARSIRATGPRLLIVGLLLASLATACSKGQGAELGKSGHKDTTTTIPQYYPLTGLEVTDSNAASRSALTVKIENSPASRPQAGLDKADVVFEAVVEGGQTRFLAIFQSQDSSNVGPVRSVRPSDPAIVSPFGGIVAYSGGIQRFVDAMRATGLKNFDETSAGNAFRRRSDRAAPHNLYTSTSALYDKAGSGSAPAKFADFLKPGTPFAPAGAVPVTHISMPVGTSTTADWDWDGSQGRWLRSTDGKPHTAEGSGQLSPNTVIVQFVPYEVTGEVDTTGAAVSEGKVVGSGDAMVFNNGVMVRAKWSKPNATAMTTWTDANGSPLQLPPGQTWVELPATGTPITTR